MENSFITFLDSYKYQGNDLTGQTHFEVGNFQLPNEGQKSKIFIKRGFLININLTFLTNPV